MADPGGVEKVYCRGAIVAIVQGAKPPTTCVISFYLQVYPRAELLIVILFDECRSEVRVIIITVQGLRPQTPAHLFVIRVGTQGNHGAVAPYDPALGSTPRSGGN